MATIDVSKVPADRGTTDDRDISEKPSARTTRFDLMEVRASCCYADPISNKGKLLQLCRILTLLLIPLACLSAMACYWLVDAIIQKSQLDSVKGQLQCGRRLGDAVFALQLEQAQVVYAIQEGNFSVMQEAFEITNNKVTIFVEEATRCYDSSLSETLRQHRETINNSHLSTSSHSEVQFYSKLTKCLLGVLLGLAKDMSHGSLWQDYISYKLMLKAQESVGVMLSLGITFFENGSLALDDYNLLRHHDAVSQELVQTTSMFSSETAILFAKLEEDEPTLLMAMEKYRSDWQVNSFPDYGHIAGEEFHDQVVVYLTNVANIKTKIGNRVLAKIDEEITVSVGFMTFSGLLCVFVLIMAPILIRLLYVLTSSIQNQAMEASRKSRQLIVERQRSDSLLYQMLPKPIAQQLKMHKEVPAEYFEQVTLYFSDIVGFTDISARSSPLEIVVLLNKLYLVCDNLLDLYDVYKVETIGDAYMVAGGLPYRMGQIDQPLHKWSELTTGAASAKKKISLKNDNQHVLEICLMALELLVAVRDCSIPHLPDTPLELRVGIHSGPVVAGVVGNKMPRYCLFGDTVNTASRMESNGLPNKIQVSSAANDLLRTVRGFDSKRRGIIEVKGKGLMETFWLTNTSRQFRSGNNTSVEYHLLMDSTTQSPAQPCSSSNQWLDNDVVLNLTTDTTTGCSDKA